mmetsp:Transcript_5576/g.12943  ORF Transcript_5576/g.12943 Transcript_5576/m.12943 type:complete len:228 (+) Transcript_5576:495-1178(+)
MVARRPAGISGGGEAHMRRGFALFRRPVLLWEVHIHSFDLPALLESYPLVELSHCARARLCVCPRVGLLPVPSLYHHENACWPERLLRVFAEQHLRGSANSTLSGHEQLGPLENMAHPGDPTYVDQKGMGVALANVVEFVDLKSFKSFQSKYGLDLNKELASLAAVHSLTPLPTSDRRGAAIQRGLAKNVREAAARCTKTFPTLNFAQIRCIREEKKRLGVPIRPTR